MRLLIRLKRGDRSAEAELVSLVHADLIRLSDRLLEREGFHSTMQPEALVQETYLRIFSVNCPGWQSPAHFFAVAAQVMWRILIDHARARQRAQSGAP